MERVENPAFMRTYVAVGYCLGLKTLVVCIAATMYQTYTSRNDILACHVTPCAYMRRHMRRNWIDLLLSELKEKQLRF